MKEERSLKLYVKLQNVIGSRAQWWYIKQHKTSGV